MQNAIDHVRTFQNKLEISQQQQMNLTLLPALAEYADTVHKISSNIQPFGTFDERWARIHLIFEEAAELAQAMANGNEVECLDAIADLLYVVLGTAATFNWPLVEAFYEIHRSNMTKQKMPTDKYNFRVRDKGPNYDPPKLKQILERRKHEN